MRTNLTMSKCSKPSRFQPAEPFNKKATREHLRSASESAREAAELALEGQLKSTSLASPLRGPSSTRPTSLGSFGSLRSLGPEAPEIDLLKDGVRSALDMMSSLEESKSRPPHEFRARASQLRPAGQWTTMPLEDGLNRFKTALRDEWASYLLVWSG